MDPETMYAIASFPVSAAIAGIGIAYFSWRKRKSDNETYAERTKADMERRKAEEESSVRILASPEYKAFLQERKRLHDEICDRYDIKEDFLAYYRHSDFIENMLNLVVPPPHLLGKVPRKKRSF